MSNFDPTLIYESPEYRQESAIQRTFMARVYSWMTIGLLITAGTAYAISTSTDLIRFFLQNIGMLIGIIVAQLAVGFCFTLFINRMPVAVAAGLFLVYSALVGVTLSILLLVYTRSSVASTFVVTAGMFGTMSVFGYVTKRDLTGLGSFMFMGLIGVVLASIVNIFLGSPMISWLISFIGVIVFTGLTAYDTQKIKQSYANGEANSATFRKTALFGAFQLYLDFINLFIFLLRLMGTRRN